VLNVHGVHEVRQMDIHTAEPLVPEPSLVEVEITIGEPMTQLKEKFFTISCLNLVYLRS
jgi:hypothetical protein